MRVRDKITGQVGELPDNELQQYAGRYEPLEQPKAQAQSTAKSGGLGGQIGSFLMSLVKPTTDWIKQEQGDLAASGPPKLNANSIIDSLLGGMLLREQDGKLGLDVKGVKSMANLASFVLPGSKVAGFKAGLLPGAARGALSSASREDATLGSTLGGAATGSFLEGVFGKIFGRGAGKAGQNFEKEVQRGILSPKVARGPMAAQQEVDLVDKVIQHGKDYGVTLGKGSAESQRRALPELFSKISKKVEVTAANTGRKLSKGSTFNQIKKLVSSDGENFIRGDKVNTNALKDILSLAKKTTKGSTISDTGILTVKRFVSQKYLGKAFSKIENGSPLTLKEGVAMDVWKQLDSILAPSVKGLTRKLHDLYDLYPGLASSADYGLFLPVAGRVSALGTMTQALGSKLGQGAGGIGRIQEAVGGSPTSEMLKRIITPAVLGQPGTTESQPTGDQQPVQDISEFQINLPQDNGGGISEDQYRAAMMHDLTTTGGKNISKIEAFSKFGAKSAAQKKAIMAVQSASPIYDQLVELSLSAGTGIGSSVKSLLGLIPNVEGGPEQDLDKVTNGYAAAIAKGFAGESGVATDQDINRWKDLMPKLTDTVEERRRSLLRLKQVIEARIASTE